jgi:hypothetical protein
MLINEFEYLITYPFSCSCFATSVLEIGIICKGSHTSQTFRVAYILLNCDEGKYAEKVTNEQVSKVLKVGMGTVDRVKTFCLRGRGSNFDIEEEEQLKS